MAVLSLHNLNVYFKRGNGRKDINVVNDLFFDVQQAEIFGLVGESGCGKSITAYSIIGILPQSAYYEGDIFFEGRNLKDLTAEESRRLRGNKISMIFQEPMTSLNPVLTVGYQIAEVLMTHRKLSRKNAMTKTVELLRSVRIPSPEIRIRDYPHQLSGGMRQRVMIAMAIACDPSLLIADEPTTALDVTIQSQILQLLRDIKKEKNMSILLITHDLGLISENAKRVAIMYAGRIMELSSTIKLLQRPLHPYTIGLLDSLPKDRHIPLKPIPGSVPRPDELPEGCKFSNRCSFSIRKCKEKEPVLIDMDNGHLVRCIRAGEIKWK